LIITSWKKNELICLNVSPYCYFALLLYKHVVQQKKTDIDKVNEEKVTISHELTQTKNKGIVLLDDDGNLGDLFKSGGDEIGSVNKYLMASLY
jgi:hypothetical protein